MISLLVIARHALPSPTAVAQEELSFSKTILEQDVSDPMQLAIADDGRVFFVERGGRVKLLDPDGGATKTLAKLDVTTSQEDGLLGIELDPNFQSNNWMYLFYSPEDIDGVQLLSRFTLDGDELDLSTEKVLLVVPVQREECCHSGGGLAFDENGILYIGVGDNTNPFASSGRAPIDERPGREAWDAQRTSANSHDLRGKILRIRPLPDGTYEIPEGNLFPPDGSEGLPEIYVMGVRNSFRFSIDSQTGWLYFGDVGPDGPNDRNDRGPRGYDEFNRTRTPGNFGWPYFIADNKPYRDYDFATDESGEWFDPEAPVNESPNNTGNVELPLPRPAWIYYPYGESDEFPEMGDQNQRAAFAGPVFRGGGEGEGAFPPSYDGALFIYDWVRNWIQTVRFDEDWNITSIEPFMPDTTFTSPIDIEFGPDGRMYMIEWGDGFFEEKPDSQVVRIDYTGTPWPRAHLAAAPISGPAPLEVSFDGTASESFADDPDLQYEWDFDGDGDTDSTSSAPSFVYEEAGNYVARLTITDDLGHTNSATVSISAGNSAPEVQIIWPLNGGIADFGDIISYGVEVSDAEDHPVESTDIRVQPSVGHNTHAHPMDTFFGPAGAFKTEIVSGHGPDANIFILLSASYTDHGAPGVDPITAVDEIILQPRRKQAQHFSDSFGLQLEHIAPPETGDVGLAFINDGHWASYEPVNLAGIDSLLLRVASDSAGGTVELHHNSPDGPLLGSLFVPNTGGWDSWTTMEMDITDPGDTHELFFVFRGDHEGLMNLNWFEFQGPGMSFTTFQDWVEAAELASGSDAPADDPGGFGIPNVLRYAFALDPHQPERDGLPKILVTETADAEKRISLEYTRRRTGGDFVAYAPEVSTDLLHWTPLPEEAEIERTDLGNGLEKVTIKNLAPADTTRRFIRIGVTLAPE